MHNWRHGKPLKQKKIKKKIHEDIVEFQTSWQKVWKWAIWLTFAYKNKSFYFFFKDILHVIYITSVLFLFAFQTCICYMIFRVNIYQLILHQFWTFMCNVCQQKATDTLFFHNIGYKHIRGYFVVSFDWSHHNIMRYNCTQLKEKIVMCVLFHLLHMNLTKKGMLILNYEKGVGLAW